MSSIQEIYVDNIRQRFGGYRPVWSPLTQVHPGDILVLDDAGSFQRIGTLQDVLGANAPEVQIQPSTAQMPIDFVSSDEVKFVAKFAGEFKADFPTVPAANAAFSYEFGGKGDFALAAETAMESSIDNLVSLEKPLNEALDAHTWDVRYIIAAKVLATPRFSLIVSETKSSKLELTLSGTLKPALKELGKADVTVQISSARGLVSKFLGVTNATPFVCGVRLVPSIGRKDRIFHIVD